MESDKLYCVYKHTAPNGKVYIGITKQKPKYRWGRGSGYRTNEHFTRAMPFADEHKENISIGIRKHFEELRKEKG